MPSRAGADLKLSATAKASGLGDPPGAKSNGPKSLYVILLLAMRVAGLGGARCSKGQYRAVLRQHIATVAGRCKARSHSSDVVNEAIQLKDDLFAAAGSDF
jgi:hypothetical protein